MSNGAEFSGQWEYGHMHTGRATYPDGANYDGTWKTMSVEVNPLKAKWHGQGTYCYKDGRK